MRAGPILLSLFLLTACQLTGGGTVGTGAAGLAADEIVVTPLDEPPPAAEAGSATEADPALPPAEAEMSVAPESLAEPEAPKTAEQLLCEARGGIWTVAGNTGAYLCVQPTRDGGKACHKESDCEGQCLARSMSCAPFTPLFGCNEVLDKQGRRVTLCID